MTDNGDSQPSEVVKRFGLSGPPPIRPRMLILLFILIGTSGVLWYQNFLLQQRLAKASRQVEGLADFLERAERNSFTRDDFEVARSEWEGLLTDTAGLLLLLPTSRFYFKRWLRRKFDRWMQNSNVTVRHNH